MIIHIPHTKTKIPKSAKFIVDITKEIVRVTDWYLEELFAYTLGSSPLVFPYSRVYCDVERFIDDPLNNIGNGIFYTHDLDGNEIREFDDEQYEEVLSAYKKHGVELASLCGQWLAYFSPVIVIDAHSYSDHQALAYGYSGRMPDICIGTDSAHTPDDLVASLKKYFEMNNLSVDINFPYSGTIISEYYKEDGNVLSIMIEVNKRLYLNPDCTRNQNFNHIKHIIYNALDLINNYMELIEK